MARVSRCKIFIDNVEMIDFKNYQVVDEVVAEKVKLQNFTDYTEVPPEYGFSIDYAIPAGKKEYDFRKIDGESTIRVAKIGGGSTTWLGCKTLIVGGETIDGEKEAVKTITIFAKKRSDS
jgi:hypothetical protein